MSDALRYEHRIIETGQHVVTSPDVKGLCIVRDSEHEARQDAVEMVALFRARGLPLKPHKTRTRHQIA